MKFIAFAAAASALVIPDASIINQLILADANKAVGSPFGGVVDGVKAGVEKGIEAVNDWLREGLDKSADDETTTADLDAFVDGAASSPKDLPIFDPIIGKGKSSNLTIYQLISSSNYTTNFTSLVNQFPAVVEILNTTSLVPGTNHTLFVPVDTAFAALPGGALNESRPEVLESIVRYHIGLGDYGYNVMFSTHTVPSAYNEPLLGGAAQRLRVRFEKALGVRVNFNGRIVAANFAAANGIIHGVDSLIVPPTFVGRELSLLPAHYSTLLLAMAQTNFTDFMHSQILNGSTVFAPSNVAFTGMGPEVNAFLFNTPRGLKYLEALLKYSIVPNATVYSDAYYGDATPIVAPGPIGGVIERAHYDLPTLLGSARLTVNVTSIPGYSIMLVNDAVKVDVQDGVAKNGVVQEVGEVVLPPLPGAPPAAGKPGAGWGGGKKLVITVPELIARLGPYVDDDETVPPTPEAAKAAATEL
ncbi:fasciclin domain family protein [Ophiostoma piceae UAMH 11346]|uniref:Fasciclin domain family protein n=1 Tax=Ophiostoma piceae (strain UAMH 11346) TaxID=1262450 RepID=S3BNT7_OPHP1|nr:fasciclin domain family protein [Ophiostoma piceae UAMH 11346]